MRIGHISDLHILALDGPAPSEFFNKRIVGGLNLLLNRSGSHSVDVVKQALRRLDDLEVDHIVISGDLTNLALDSEFAAAAELVHTVNDAPQRVSVVPGNHDYYTPGAEKNGRFEHHFEPFLHSDLPQYQSSNGYPFCHLRGDVAFVGLNSGIATAWFLSNGEVGREELRHADRLLADPAVQSRFKVVIVHHPLLPDQNHAIQWTRRMRNDEEVLELIRQRDVDLVVHGHTHYFSTFQLPKLGSPGTTYICEAGCTSVSGGGDPRLAGKFNIYTIDDKRLTEIETHLFESVDSGFTPWKSQVFRRDIEAP